MTSDFFSERTYVPPEHQLTYFRW